MKSKTLLFAFSLILLSANLFAQQTLPCATIVTKEGEIISANISKIDLVNCTVFYKVCDKETDLEEEYALSEVLKITHIDGEVLYPQKNTALCNEPNKNAIKDKNRLKGGVYMRLGYLSNNGLSAELGGISYFSRKNTQWKGGLLYGSDVSVYGINMPIYVANQMSSSNEIIEGGVKIAGIVSFKPSKYWTFDAYGGLQPSMGLLNSYSYSAYYPQQTTNNYPIEYLAVLPSESITFNPISFSAKANLGLNVNFSVLQLGIEANLGAYTFAGEKYYTEYYEYYHWLYAPNGTSGYRNSNVSSYSTKVNASNVRFSLGLRF